MASSSNWILSLKTLLISSGVVSIAMVLKFSLPLILNEVPVMWSTLLLWLKPPYLYVIINGIIITIAASSRFLHKIDHDNQSEPLDHPKPPTPSDNPPPEFSEVVLPAVYESEVEIVDVKPVVVNGSEVTGDEDKDEVEFTILRSTWTPPKKIQSPEIEMEQAYPITDKPLVSTRFGHRKPVKAPLEGGRALRRVAKPKRHETLENTWKTITDGRHVPLTRHLKKSDTFENHHRQLTTQDSLINKSETFKDRTNYNDNNNNSAPTTSFSPSPGPSSRLRKEPSLSQDELNRRVEAFIKKFNEDMRMQRQESLNQYTDMVKRVAH